MKREPFNPGLIASPPDERRPLQTALLTVSQLTGLVKNAIAAALPPTVHVVGEVSNFKRHSSGHLYFTLKDSGSELSCVMWRADAAKLKFAAADGLEVVATGAVEVFERAGRYQLYARRLEPRGVGALELAFRQLCEKLEKEGLFDPRHKKPLPRYPRRIVLVTSPTGAAIADMLRTIERRFPCVHVLVFPVRVQGDGAAAEIARAIRAVDASAEGLGGIDAMIVGRGGGSLEDLWAFNEEVVARAIFECRVPIVSGVGHEVDVTIADLVADVRAATPTAAAELAVPVLDEVLAGLDVASRRMGRAIRGVMELGASHLRGMLGRMPFADPVRVALRRVQLVDEIAHRLHRTIARRVHLGRAGVDRCEPSVQRIAPHVFLIRTSARLARCEQAIRIGMIRRVGSAQRAAGEGRRWLEGLSPRRLLEVGAQRVSHVGGVLDGAMGRRLESLANRLHSVEALLNAVSHRSVLTRGYSITRTRKGRRVVRRVGELHDRERIVTQLSDGEFESETVNIHQKELFDDAP